MLSNLYNLFNFETFSYVKIWFQLDFGKTATSNIMVFILYQKIFFKMM